MKTTVEKTTKHRSRRFRRFIRANEAVSALEYAVLVGVVVVGIGAALGTAFQNEITKALKKAGDNRGRARLTTLTEPDQHGLRERGRQDLNRTVAQSVA